MFLGQLRYGFDFYDGNAFVAYSQLLFGVEWYAAAIIAKSCPIFV